MARLAELHADPRNPRLGGSGDGRSPRDILQYLFDHDNAIDIAESISIGGYFPNEPLLAVREQGDLTVVEGNRRLAALKGLHDPSLIVGPHHAALTRLASRVSDPASLQKVPVTIAPTRRSTDRQLAARHVDRAVLPWTTENKARFIIDKSAAGYSESELQSELGFSLADIREARRLVAIADMMRAIPLPGDLDDKVSSPRTSILTTIDRVMSSAAGRRYLHIEPDAQLGLRGTTSAAEFQKGFARLVRDVASGAQTSRTLNTDDDIKAYFGKWEPEELPAKKKATFAPSDIIGATPKSDKASPNPARDGKKRTRKESKSVLPKSLVVKYGSEKLVRIRKELTELPRDRFPNAGAVLLRVFLELAILDYLDRTGDLEPLVKRLGGKGELQNKAPKMRSLAEEILKQTKPLLKASEYQSVQRALSYNDAARFSVGELNAFVHRKADLPVGDDLHQFWNRVEPLVRLMVEEPAATSQK